MKQKRKLPFLYGIVDWLLSVLAWTLFYYFRKTYEIPGANMWQRFSVEFHDKSFWFAVAIISVCWVVLYGITGAYQSVYFLNSGMDAKAIRERVPRLFTDKACGSVFRVKGFFQDEIRLRHGAFLSIDE